MPVERQRRHGDQDTIARLQDDLAAARAEAAILRARVTDLTRMVMAEAEPAVQQAIRDGQPSGRHRRPPGARWLRAVPAIAVLAARPARHKLLAGLAAASVAVVVAAPGMDLAPWISGTPAHRAPAVVKAYTPPPAGGGGGVAVPPPRSSPPGSSPPPSPVPAGSPAATPTGTDTPAPDPSATATDTPATDTPSPSPAATDTPDPDPTTTAAACPPPGKHKG